jgi:NodT family efflux transporter outer membrane factor (OMF) lipoprotein
LLTELFGTATHDFGIDIMPSALPPTMPPTPATDATRDASTAVLGWLATLTVGLLSACAAVGPTYHAPTSDALALASTWQAARPHQGEAAQLQGWWARLGDPVLTELQRAANENNPSMQKAAAQIASARAALASSKAAGAPTLTGSGSATRANTSAGNSTVASTTASVGLDASWELDLFGSVRRNVEAGEATAQAREADWNDTRVSLAAEVATDYITYRACLSTLQLTRDDATSRQATAQITIGSYRAGASSSTDAALAEASAASARASLLAQQAECEVDVKALVPLTGLAEPALRTLLSSADYRALQSAPFAVQSLPVALLSQRPDLVAKERALAAASASIGVAEAGRYPRLSLSGSISRSVVAPGSGQVLSTPWSFGPSLSLPLFDGGAAKASVRSAEASYAIAQAEYRQAVSTAVLEVEQNLVRLTSAEAREADVQRSADGYRAVANATEASWRAGSDSLLSVEQTRRDAISAAQSLITVQRDRLLYGVALYKAVGGGWDANATVAATETPGSALAGMSASISAPSVK